MIGLYLNSMSDDETLVQYNLFQNNNSAGPASGTAIYSDLGLWNAVIDQNKFVNNQDTAININSSGGSNNVSNNEMDSQNLPAGPDGQPGDRQQHHELR